MDTLRIELERAIPHVDAENNDSCALIGAGKQALRRRRTRVAGALAAGGLVAAGVALGASAVVAPDGLNPGGDRTVATAPTPGHSARPVTTTALTLASLQKVANACGETNNREVELNALTGTLSSGGRDIAPTHQVKGDHWVAAEFPCGSQVIRVLQQGDGGVVGRYGANEGGTLAEWAEANAR